MAFTNLSRKLQRKIIRDMRKRGRGRFEPKGGGIQFLSDNRDFIVDRPKGKPPIPIPDLPENPPPIGSRERLVWELFRRRRRLQGILPPVELPEEPHGVDPPLPPREVISGIDEDVSGWVDDETICDPGEVCPGDDQYQRLHPTHPLLVPPPLPDRPGDGQLLIPPPFPDSAGDLPYAGMGTLGQGTRQGSETEKAIYYSMTRSLSSFFGIKTVEQLDALLEGLGTLHDDYVDYKSAASKAASDAYSNVASKGGTWGFIFKFQEATLSAVKAYQIFESENNGTEITQKAYDQIGEAIGKISDMASVISDLHLRDFVSAGIITQEGAEEFSKYVLNWDKGIPNWADLPGISNSWGLDLGIETAFSGQSFLLKAIAKYDETLFGIKEAMVNLGRTIYPKMSEKDLREKSEGSKSQRDKYKKTILVTTKAIYENRKEIADLEQTGYWDGLEDIVDQALRWGAQQMGAFLGIFGMSFEAIFGKASFQMSIQLPKLTYATAALVKASSNTVVAGAYEHSEVFIDCRLNKNMSLEDCEKQAEAALKKAIRERGRREFDDAFRQIQEYSTYVDEIEERLLQLQEILKVGLGELADLLKYILIGGGVVVGGYVLYQVS